MSEEDDERRRRGQFLRMVSDTQGVTPDERRFLQDVARDVEAGTPVGYLDRKRVQRIQKRLAFG